jgi:hypothetical protein
MCRGLHLLLAQALYVWRDGMGMGGSSSKGSGLSQQGDTQHTVSCQEVGQARLLPGRSACVAGISPIASKRAPPSTRARPEHRASPARPSPPPTCARASSCARCMALLISALIFTLAILEASLCR